MLPQTMTGPGGTAEVEAFAYHEGVDTIHAQHDTRFKDCGFDIQPPVIPLTPLPLNITSLTYIIVSDCTEPHTRYDQLQ